MLRPQMWEAIFVAGSVFAGMTGRAWTKAPVVFAREKIVRVELLSASAVRHFPALAAGVCRIALPR